MVKLTKAELERLMIYKNHQISSSTLGDLVDTYGRDAYIQAEIESGYYGEPDYAVLYVSETRLETDEEYNARIEALKVNKQALIDQRKEKQKQDKIAELALYEKLKQKYGWY